MILYQVSGAGQRSLIQGLFGKTLFILNHFQVSAPRYAVTVAATSNPSLVEGKYP